MKVSYNWLKDYLGDTLPPADEVATLLTFKSFEIEEVIEKGTDTIIDIDVLPNRSSDCLSHRGIARELAAILDMPLEHDPLAASPTLPTTDAITVEIEDATTCPRFTASLITGVTVGESPQWLQERLVALGQRPINNIVDATNYVMLALGQPLHAYDADKFPKSEAETWQFLVRAATPGETVSLIAEGGKDEARDVELTGSELLIVDKTSGTPVGLAGVKGGRFAGVDESTTNVIIEAAHFDPIRTRQTARGLGIVIEASKRFENEPSRELPLYAQQEIATLIADIAGGTCEGILDEYLETKPNPTVVVSVEKTNALLGLSLTIDEMNTLLVRVGCTTEITEGGITATGPWERTDLTIEEDFIEEIGRIFGYEHVAAVVPDAAPLAELNVRHYYSERVRETLIALGYSEVITSSFRKKDSIQLQNALASDKSYVRSALTKNIAESLDKNIHNADLLGTTGTRVFEIGTVFTGGNGTVDEHVALALGVRLRPAGYSGKEDKELQAAIEAVEAAIGVKLEWSTDKGVAETNLSAVFNTLPVPEEYEPVVVPPAVTYQPFSTYPFIARDISLWVNEGTAADEVEHVLKDAAGELCVRITRFDEFTKDGRTSFAFRLVFQASDRTLTDEEVNIVMNKIYKSIAKNSWEVR